MADVQYVTVTLSDGTPVQVVAGTQLHAWYLALAARTSTVSAASPDIDLTTLRPMAWFMTPHGPQSVIEPATIAEFRRRDYAEITAQQAADFFAGVAEIPDVSFITGQELSAAMAAFGTPPKALTTNYALRPEQSARLGGAASTTINCIGVDPVAGVIFGVNTTNSRVVQSDNFGTSWSNTRTLPADVTYSNVSRIVRHGAYVYMLAKTTADGLYKVFRAPPVAQAGDWTWSSPLLTLASGVTGFSFAMEASDWGTGTEYLFVSEYGDPVGGPSIYRTADGVTWATVHGPDPTMRHIHHVMPDPHNPGHVWATCGDGVSKTIMRSTDSGATWTTAVASAAWQAVQISYTEDYVWLAGDSRQGTAFVIDRDTNTPYFAASNYHHHTPPPGGIAGRSVTDGSITTGSVTLQSATAAFTSTDLGRYVYSGNSFPPFTRITAINSATSVQMSAAALATGAGDRSVRISGDMYFANAYCGAVDPNTGIYYGAAMDTSNAGTTMGLFFLPRLGGRVEILDPGGVSISMNSRVYMLGGYLFCGQWRRELLATALPPTVP